MTPKEQDESARTKLQVLGRVIQETFPSHWGFVLLAFPFDKGGRMNYVSNAKRVDVVRVMYEFISATKKTWADHKPEQSAAEEDDELARALQRIAELESYLQNHANPASAEYYLCGPPLMIKACNKMLAELGVPAHQIAYDEF